MNFPNMDARHPEFPHFPFEWAMRRRFGGRRGRHHAHGGFGPTERGSIKYDILAVLVDGPRHGYDIMAVIEERRGFRPSPGSIYPALQMLDDGDFVTSREAEGKRVYDITDTGRTLLATYRDSPEGARSDERPSAGAELAMRGMRTVMGLRDAVKAIARTGDVASIEAAVEILGRTRRELYALLAEEK